MQIQPERTFLSPSRELRELNLLTALEETPELSQSEMADRIGVSSTMVNNYLKTFQKDGLVQVKGTTNRSFNYNLTAAGRRHMNDLLMNYAVEIIQIYSSVKQQFARKLEAFYDNGLKRAAIYGAAETGEVVLAAAHDTRVEVVDVVDGDVSRHGTFFHGHKILSPELLSELAIDGVIITSFARRDEIYLEIKHLEAQGLIIADL